MTQIELTPNESLTGKWKLYPAYKDSGVEWLGKIPVHWDIAPLYSRYSIQLGKMRNQDNITGLTLAPYLRNVNIQWDHVDITDVLEMDFSSAERSKYALEYGDLLVCEGGEVGRTAIWRSELPECYIQNAVHRVRPLTSKEEGRFLFYVLYAVASFGVFKAEVNRSTIGHLTSEKLKVYRFIFPPLTEQRVITAFLDCQTTRINTLIEKKERLIKLLQEKRAALISHAVTKGLDPAVPMKDSGVEWLGEIPVHWGVNRLKNVTKDMIAGPFGSSLTKDLYTKHGYRVYGQEQVIPADFSKGDYYISEDLFLTMRRYAVSVGDVLVSCVGTFGKVAVVPPEAEPGIINPRLVKLIPNREMILPTYLVLFLRSRLAFDQMEQLSRGGTMGIINLSLLSDTLILLPSLSIQQAILTYIDKETANIDALVSRIREGIEKLKEYSTALISAAVTGKIDVRGETSMQDTEM